MKLLKMLGLILVGIPLWAATPLVGPNISPYVDSTSTYTLTDQAGKTASLITNTLTVNSNAIITGNLAVTGTTGSQNGTNETLSGIQTFSPTTQVNVSTLTPINITATNMVIESTGATVTFSTNSVIPAITTATAVAGQFLILQSTTSASTVVISTGIATAVLGDSLTYTISSGKNPVELIYDAVLSVWKVINQQ